MKGAEFFRPFLCFVPSKYALLTGKWAKNTLFCIFFAFFWSNIWSIQKKAVPLHPLSKRERSSIGNIDEKLKSFEEERRNNEAPYSRSESVKQSLFRRGAVVQLVRISACHAGGREFESRRHRKKEDCLGNPLFLCCQTRHSPVRVFRGIGDMPRVHYRSAIRGTSSHRHRKKERITNVVLSFRVARLDILPFA